LVVAETLPPDIARLLTGSVHQAFAIEWHLPSQFEQWA
jgi:hypothetical protein